MVEIINLSCNKCNMITSSHFFDKSALFHHEEGFEHSIPILEENEMGPWNSIVASAHKSI